MYLILLCCQVFSDCVIQLLGTLSDASACIPTVTDNAYSQGLITTEEVGISFEPTDTISSQNGELTVGGTDSSKYTGAIAYVFVLSAALFYAF